tara:strand:+ start:481 stop:777 length:297 start_codon:yes stop_codon:yes gene_type:complete
MNIADKTLKQNLDWSEEYTKDLTIPEEWENVSYKNDIAPSWHYNGWHIYIHHYDKNNPLREGAEFRFCVMVDDKDCRDEEEYFCTNQFKLVLMVVMNL